MNVRYVRVFVRQYFMDFKLLVNGTVTAWYRVHFENWLANDNTVFLMLCNVANLFVPIASSLQSTEGYQSFGSAFFCFFSFSSLLSSFLSSLSLTRLYAK